MIVDNLVYAIVPARGGSKGVPRKNIQPLAGHPLVAYTIAAARQSIRIDRIVVSTDCPEIADICRAYGADVPFMRPAKLAGDMSVDRDFVLHALDWLEANERKLPEFLVHLRPTTPLRIPQLVDEAIDVLRQKAEATSLRSGHESPESPFKWFTKDEDDYFRGFGDATAIPGYTNMPRQTFPSVYIPDGYVDVLRTDYVRSADTIHGDRIHGFVSPFCLEVDTIDDFRRLEFEIHDRGHPLLSDLNSHFPQEGPPNV